MPLPPVGGSGLSSRAPASMGKIYSTLLERNVNRTAVYNDCYNLFNAIFQIGWFDAIWVDLELLGESLADRLPGNPKLTMFNHFTARPCSNPQHVSPKADPRVFDAFVGANSVSSRVTVIRGAFLHRRGSPIATRKNSPTLISLTNSQQMHTRTRSTRPSSSLVTPIFYGSYAH